MTAAPPPTGGVVETGLPPRVRGNLGRDAVPNNHQGPTPARAGQPPRNTAYHHPLKTQLRTPRNECDKQAKSFRGGSSATPDARRCQQQVPGATPLEFAGGHPFLADSGRSAPCRTAERFVDCVVEDPADQVLQARSPAYSARTVQPRRVGRRLPKSGLRENVRRQTLEGWHATNAQALAGHRPSSTQTSPNVAITRVLNSPAPKRDRCPSRRQHARTIDHRNTRHRRHT